MSQRLATLAWLACLFTGVSCALIGSRGPETLRVPPHSAVQSEIETGPSRAIFPTQHLPLHFDHAQHMRLPNVTCESCHLDSRTSREAADRLVPPEQTCTPCHAVDRSNPTRIATPAARCDACHVGFDATRPFAVARVEIPAPNLRFSHEAHARRGMRCEQCHGTMEQAGVGSRLQLPMMQGCFSCHQEGRTARSECLTCHLSGTDGRMRTTFAEGALNPPEWMPGLHHDADFWVTHRFVAAESGERCATCHSEEQCVACHDGRVRDRRNHPQDYVTLHPAEARQSAERCTSCHRTASFCEACHLRMGVAQDSAALARISGRFHPPPAEWSGPLVTAQHHAMEARRSMTACVSCHTERDCTSCHGSIGMGGGGIDPHPPGWALRCAMMLHAAPRACAQCHADTGALEARCR